MIFQMKILKLKLKKHLKKSKEQKWYSKYAPGRVEIIYNKPATQEEITKTIET